MSTPPNKLPNWADGVGADITEPTEAKKSLGWVGGSLPDRPPAQFVNYQWNLIFQWIEVFRDFLFLFDLNGNWVDQDSSLANAWVVADVKFDKDADSGGGLFVAVGRTSVNNRAIVTSPDGETWTVRENPGSGNQLLQRAAFAEFSTPVWCVVGSDVGDEFIMTALEDGVTWIENTSATGTDKLEGVVYDPVSDLLVAVGDNERIYSSTDGTGTWTSRNSGGSSPLLDVAHDGSGNFVAVGQNSRLATSSNGTVWTVTTINGVPFLARRVLFISRMNGGSGLWIAVGGAGGSQIATSTTGAQGSWTEITGHGIPGNTILGFVDDPKNERIVVTTDGGSIFVFFGDTDPVNDVGWTGVQSDTTESIWGIALNDLPVLNQNRFWVRGGNPDSGESGGLTQIAKSANPLF
jgi:hypothetical protein